MRLIAVLTACVFAWAPASALGFGTDADEDAGFGHVLALVHSFVRIAAQSEDPKVVEKHVDEMFAGQNPEANRAASALFDDITQDMTDAERQSFGALARDLMVLARREHARAAAQPYATRPEQALAARKELHAMGLRYYDAGQFLDAVKRNDALAVALYVEGRGVNLAARDADGRSALEIARAAGNQQIVGLLSAAM
jgi:hypothetical protein